MSRAECEMATGNPMAIRESGLAAETEAINDLLIFLLVTLLDVVEQLATLGDEGEESAAGGVVLLVSVQVIRQAEDSLSHQGDLIRGTTGVSFVELVVFQVDFFGFAHGIRDEPSRSRTVLCFGLGRGEKPPRPDLASQ